MINMTKLILKELKMVMVLALIAKMTMMMLNILQVE